MAISLFEAEQLIHGIRLLYGLDIEAVVERRTVCGLAGRNANWIWKPLSESDDERRLYELACMTNYVSELGLPCGGPIPNRNGQFITIPYPEAKPGYLQRWLPGRHVNVADYTERLGAIHAIANLHLFGQMPVYQMGSALHRGKFLSRLKMKQRTLESVLADARSHSRLFAAYEMNIQDVMEQSIYAYENWLARGRLEETFCHRDLAPHNLLWNPSGNEKYSVSVIDFDHSGFDDPLHDVLQFTSHTIFLSDCTAFDVEQMVLRYAEETGLTGERFELLLCLLAWPDILIRALVEWGRSGFEPAKEIRVLHAMGKEDRRRHLLRQMHSVKRI